MDHPENYLGANGYNYDGSLTGNKIAKSMASTTGWETTSGTGAPGNDQASNNSSGFSGLPGSCRNGDGIFYGIRNLGGWWSSSEYSASYAWGRYLGYIGTGLYLDNDLKGNGYSVRCVRGDQVSLPTLTTNPITDITQTTATGGGNVSSDGGTAVTARGVCWHTSTNPTLENKLGFTSNGSGPGAFNSNLTGLTANTTYYVCAYATNSQGTAYGTPVSFTTSNILSKAMVTTGLITDITQTTATGGGNVTSDGGAAVTARGVCWHTSANPTLVNKSGSTVNGSGTGSYTGSLTGLTPGTLYYVRAYATNSQGTSYGEQVQFRAKNEVGSFVDSRDETTYPWVKIGTQTWMASNLRYLPAVSPPSEGSETSPFYYVYGYDGRIVASARSSMDTRGALYNWPAALTACPTGWHLPTDAEWTTLENYMIANGYNYDGTTTGSKIAKSMASTTGWNTSTQAGAPGNDQASNNSSGFSGLPGGYRGSNGYFSSIENYGYWWSSTEYSPTYAWSRSLDYVGSNMYRGGGVKDYGFSVRCVRGDQVSLPTITTSPVTDITQTTANGGGNITSDGGAAVTARGVCWHTSANPTLENKLGFTTNGSGTGSFTGSLTGLAPGTVYYVRAYATNSEGTSYGEQVQFHAKTQTGIFQDPRDQTFYPWVIIGTQTWMASNLRYLPAVSPSSEGSASLPYYYVYGYQGTNLSSARSVMDVKGALYNWPAALTACPTGWHLPTDAEWTILENYMIANGYNYDGTTTDNKIAKSLASTTGWNISTIAGAPGNDQGSNNSSGFSGLPGGNRNYYGNFNDIGYYGYWWFSTEYSTAYAWNRNFNYNTTNMYRYYNYKENGFSVRCVRDF